MNHREQFNPAPESTLDELLAAHEALHELVAEPAAQAERLAEALDDAQQRRKLAGRAWTEEEAAEHRATDEEIANLSKALTDVQAEVESRRQAAHATWLPAHRLVEKLRKAMVAVEDAKAAHAKATAKLAEAEAAPNPGAYNVEAIRRETWLYHGALVTAQDEWDYLAETYLN